MIDVEILKKKVTKSEYLLFKLLDSKKGQIISRDEIAQYIYPEANIEGVSNEALDQIVSRLRKSLGKDGKLLKTKPKLGYYIDTVQEKTSAYKKREGSLIAFYGANNVGKTTQVIKLVEHVVKSAHQSFTVIKFPVYDLAPTGPLIYDILHGKNRDISFKSLEFQKLFAKNRIDFQHILYNLLEKGIDVITEGYVGTGIAWGLTWGLDLKELEDINFGLVKPSKSILLDGPRHIESIEKGNVFEEAGSTVWEKNRIEFKFLAEKYNWDVIESEGNQDEVGDKIWDLVKGLFFK